MAAHLTAVAVSCIGSSPGILQAQNIKYKTNYTIQIGTQINKYVDGQNALAAIVFNCYVKLSCEGIGQTVRKDDSCENTLDHIYELENMKRVIQFIITKKMKQFSNKENW